jgi:hypothetical protein
VLANCPIAKAAGQGRTVVGQLRIEKLGSEAEEEKGKYGVGIERESRIDLLNEVEGFQTLGNRGNLFHSFMANHTGHASTLSLENS